MTRTRVFSCRNSEIFSVAFAFDGITLASGSNDGIVRLWNAKKGVVTSKRDFNHSVYSVVFSPNGKTLFVALKDSTIRVWNVASDGICVLQGHTHCVNMLACSRDGKTLASCSGDNTMRLWNVQTKDCIFVLKREVTTIAFLPDGNRLLCAFYDCTLQLLHISSGACDPLPTGNVRPSVNEITLSPSGDLLALACCDHTVSIWSVEKQQYIHLLNGHSNWVRSVAFSPNGKLLASCGDDQTTRVWNVNSGHCIQVFSSSTWTGWLWSVSFSRNGRALAVGAGCGDVRVHSLLDYGALSRASLLLRVAVAPYVVLDVGNFLDKTRFAANDTHMHGDKIAFLVALHASAKLKVQGKR